MQGMARSGAGGAKPLPARTPTRTLPLPTATDLLLTFWRGAGGFWRVESCERKKIKKQITYMFTKIFVFCAFLYVSEIGARSMRRDLSRADRTVAVMARIPLAWPRGAPVA